MVHGKSYCHVTSWQWKLTRIDIYIFSMSMVLCSADHSPHRGSATNTRMCGFKFPLHRKGVIILLLASKFLALVSMGWGKPFVYITWCTFLVVVWAGAMHPCLLLQTTRCTFLVVVWAGAMHPCLLLLITRCTFLSGCMSRGHASMSITSNN